MPLTYTGRDVSERTDEHPSLVDIAVGLSRQPRFAGHGRRWWSVLDHTLFCDELVKLMAVRAGVPTRLWRLAMLLHDAHEAITADVPTPCKTDDFRALQTRLDQRIMRVYFPPGYAAYETVWHDPVRRIDEMALRAEAWAVGPSKAGEYFEEPNDDAVCAIHAYLEQPYAARPPLDFWQEKHPAVEEYLRRIHEVL